VAVTLAFFKTYLCLDGETTPSGYSGAKPGGLDYSGDAAAANEEPKMCKYKLGPNGEPLGPADNDYNDDGSDYIRGKDGKLG
jgi:hypothetical protein